MKISFFIHVALYLIAMIVLMTGIGTTLEIGGEEGRYISAPYIEGFHMTWWFVGSMIYFVSTVVFLMFIGEINELARKV